MGDFFGSSVAISNNNIAVVGARRDDNDVYGYNAGCVYVFELDDVTGEWIYTAKLMPSIGGSKDQFGNSVDIYDNYIIVGSKNYDNGNKLSCGNAYIFEKNVENGTWDEISILGLDTLQSYDYFGGSVGIYNNYAIVGAYGADGGNDDHSGCAYLFKKDDITNEWILYSQLEANEDDSESLDYLSTSLSIYENNIVLGAPNNGKVIIYEIDENNNNVNLIQTIINEENHFGYSLSISNNYLIIGSPYTNINGLNNNITGESFIYKKNNNNNNFNLITKLLPYDASIGDYFGYSLSIDNNNNIIYIGSPRNWQSGVVYYENIENLDNEFSTQNNTIGRRLLKLYQ